MNNKKLLLIVEKTPEIVKLLMTWCDKAKILDFLAPLLLRLYLIPILWLAGSKKFINFTSTVDWFGNNDWGLGLPIPYLLVFLVALIEVLGALFLLIGFGVRLISIPLMLIMFVAGLSVHLKNGWLAIAEGSGIFSNERTVGAIEKLDRVKGLMKDYGNYEWLTENGSVVILNNGIEFAATYFIMLLALFFIGAGNFVSVDYWLKRKFTD